MEIIQKRECVILGNIEESPLNNNLSNSLNQKQYQWILDLKKYRESTNHNLESFESPVFSIDSEKKIYCYFELITFVEDPDNNEYLSYIMSSKLHCIYIQDDDCQALVNLRLGNNGNGSNNRYLLSTGQSYDVPSLEVDYFEGDLINVKIVFKIYSFNSYINNMQSSLILNDFKRMYEEKKYADVILVGNTNKEFPVHKNVLSYRSPLFASMLDIMSSNSSNDETKKIFISDINDDILEEMLKFIYYSEIENTEINFSELLTAAEKYKIMDLKRKCEAILCNDINVQNFYNLFVTANACESDMLKKMCICFVREEIKEIYNAATFVQFKNSYPQVLIDILSSLSIYTNYFV